MTLTDSPWGSPQRQREIAPGLIHVTTSRHGGFFLATERWKALEALFPTLVSFTGVGWLEEDCDWALAVLAWPDLFSAQAVYNAVRVSADREDGAISAAWQASPHGQHVQAIADAFAATVADHWETGGMSAPVDGHPSGSWAVDLHRNGQRKVAVFPAYPNKQFYADGEVTALPVLVRRTADTVPVMRPSLFPSAASSRRRRGPVPLGNRGQFAEDLLETVHDIYRLSRQADVTKIPTPVGRGRQIEQGHFEAWYIQPSVSDYLGTVAPEGRGLALELKSVLDSTFSLIKLAPHQRAFLDRWDRMGALAYLLVLFRGTQLHPRGAVLKWPAFLQEIEAANLRTQRFSWERLATAFRASAEVPEASGPHPDYLPAIRTVEARVAT